MPIEGARRSLRRLRSCPPPSAAVRVDWRAVEAAARRKLADWRGVVTRQVTQGRELVVKSGRDFLRQLLIAPIVFTPFEENGRRGYRFAGEALLTGLFAGVLEVTRVASPQGFEPWFQP